VANAKRKCRWCKQYGSPADGQIINGAFYCSMDHAIAYGKAKAPQAIRKAHRAQKAAYAAQDTGKLKNSTQTAVNKLCRLLDQGRPCISCGRPDEGGRKRNASHYKSRGSNSFLRYNLRNLTMSCSRCNLELSGNLLGYREGIIERYGQAMLDYLDNAPRLRDWTPDELRQIAAEAKAEIKRIESGQGQSRDWRALPENNLK
jgi:5-methylcytosine-specific restriction endonuclease McrA